MPRFVILRHDSPQGLHWDFMLERGSSLATWALEREPAEGEVVCARALSDHRLAYLDHEGPVSGDRGSVTRWDAGTYQFEHEGPDEMVVKLQGNKLSGQAELRRLPDSPQQWHVSFSTVE